MADHEQGFDFAATGSRMDSREQGFDFAAVDALPRLRTGAGELRIGLAEADAAAGPALAEVQAAADPALPEAQAAGAPALLEPEAADGPALLFIPGAYHGAWCYAGWLKACSAARIACAALDYRGHGHLAAEGLSPAATVEDYAEDSVAAARTFAAPPIIVGHSLGGLVAMAAALRTPLAGMVLVAPSPPGNLPGARSLPAADETRLRPIPDRAEVLQRFLGGQEGAHVDACMARLTPESPRALNQRYRLALPIDAARISAPVLVIGAGLDCDERHPAGQDEAIARFFGGQFAHVAGAPHCMMLGRTCLPALHIILDWRARLT